MAAAQGEQLGVGGEHAAVRLGCAASDGSSTAASNVAGSAGSATASVHSARRTRAGGPAAVASSSSGSPWSTKNGNGAVSPYSSPMNSSGVNGDSSTVAAATSRWRWSYGGRAPAGVLPTWSWLDVNTTKRSCGDVVGGPAVAAAAVDASSRPVNTQRRASASARSATPS